VPAIFDTEVAVLMKSVSAAAALVSASLLLASCGGGSPAQPAPLPSTPTPTPTPAPTPTPKPLSVIGPCSLAASNPAAPSCSEPAPRLSANLNGAIDRVITERPDLFDLGDVNGGPKILDYDAYMTAVVAAINQAGLCGKVDAEGEIGIKSTNTYNEQWIIASHAGWNPPIGNWVRRKYVGACAPAVF
jgi:hypothetical protein